MQYGSGMGETKSQKLTQAYDACRQQSVIACETLEQEDYGLQVRLIGVTASNLVREGEGQAQLFPDPDRERDRKLDSIMDRVHGKFGPMLKRGGHRR